MPKRPHDDREENKEDEKENIEDQDTTKYMKGASVSTKKENGEHSNGEHSNGEHSNGEHSKGENSNSEHSNGEHSNGEYSNGKHSNGEHSNGEHSNGEHSNGIHSYDELNNGEHSNAKHNNGEHGDGEQNIDGLSNANRVEENGVDRNHTLSGFQQTRILMNDPKSKRVHVLGRFQGEEAIVTMVKTPFSERSVSQILSGETSLENQIINDSCGQYEAITPPSNNIINTQIIKPATNRHIMKYTKRRPYLIFETPDMYNKITKPYLENHSYGVQWVYNILEHREEAERIIYEDTDKVNGFVLIPCVKWDTKQTEDMLVIALVQRRDLITIRDLNAEHIPLLKNILDKGMEMITKKYNVLRTQVRAYLHYLPSYEHLHVNFSHLMHDAGGQQVEKAHLLIDVIYNLEKVSSDFYEKRTLPVKLYEQDPLLQLLFNATDI